MSDGDAEEDQVPQVRGPAALQPRDQLVVFISSANDVQDSLTEDLAENSWGASFAQRWVLSLNRPGATAKEIALRLTGLADVDEIFRRLQQRRGEANPGKGTATVSPIVERAGQILPDVTDPPGTAEAQSLPFDTFAIAYRDRLVRHLVVLCHGDRGHAEDVAQEALLVAYRKWDTLRNPDRAYGWLMTIATRLAWLFRDQEVAQVRLQHEAAHVSSGVSPDRDIAVAVDIANVLASLPGRQRLVATLVFVAEMTPKEVAEYLGVAASTVRAQLHQARQILRLRLGYHRGAV